MGNTLIILMGYILTFILILVIISLLLRIRKLERKLINFSPTEAYAIMENMHEMVMESSRIADSLEAAIKQKEAVLEDLSDLVDEKLKLYERINNNNRYADIKPREEKVYEPKRETNNTFISSESLINEKINKQPVNIQTMNIPSAAKVTETENKVDGNKVDKKTRIIMLHKSGKTEVDIAKELGISVTEVQLALRLLPKV